MDSSKFTNAGSNYMAVTTALRVHRVQEVCKKKNVDLILLIPGLDGKENAGAPRAISYLLRGLSGRKVLEGVHNDAFLDNAVVVVGPSYVGVYCSRSCHAETQALLSLCHNVIFFCPSPEEAEDPDLAEEHKIHSFFELLGDAKRVGVPLTPTSSGSRRPSLGQDTAGETMPGNPMEMESWPLIQAHAVEGMGKGGFFTMAHEVVDVTADLHVLYTSLDAHAIDQILRTSISRLCLHWREMLHLLDARNPTERLTLTEGELAEPLTSYYSYGNLRTVPGVKKDDAGTGPRVMFGPRTGHPGVAVQGHATIAHSGLQGEPALHMVAEAADALTGVRCARTYFLSNGQVVPLSTMLPYVAAVDHDGLLSILDQQAEAQADGKVHPAFADHDVDNVEDAHEQNDSILDAAMLLQLYAALVEAARAAMLHYSTVSSATVGTAQQAAVDVLKQHRATCRHSPTSKDLRPVYDAAHSLVFDLWSYDHTTSLSQHTSHGDRRVKVLRVELPRIPSAVHSGKLLGSLIYADSFIDLPRAGKSDRRELLVLTDAVPPLLTWSSSGAEEKEAAMSIAHLQRVMKAATSVAWQSEVGMLGMGVPVVGEEAIAGARHSRRSSTTHRRRSSTSGSAVGSWVLGWPLLDEGEHVRLCVPCDVLQVVYGTWYTFEHGLVFVSPRMGPFILDFGSNCVSSAALHYEDQDHIPVAIVFETSAQAISPFGPFHSLVANTTMPVQLTFDMSTLAPPARRHFVREVLPAWQDMWRQCHVRYYPEADLPLPLALTTANLEGKVYPVMVPDELVAAFLAGMDSEDAIQRCMDLRRPPQGLSPSIPCRGISATPRGRRMIPITLVCGLPGSGKMSLCTHLVKFLGNSRRWFVIRNNLQEGPRKLSEEKIQRSLGEVLRATGSYFRVGSSRTLNLAGDGDMDENDIRSSPNDSSVISPTSSQHSTPYSSFSDLSKAGEVSQDTTAMPHVLLVCPGLIPLSQMVEAVNSCNHVMDGRCGIVSVTACVSAGMLFENSEQVKALPGIAENLVAGLIDNVVLFDTQGIPHTHLNAIHAFIRNRNPIARLFDVSRGNLGEMLESVVKGIECSEEEGAPSLEEGEADVRRFLGTDDNASPLSLVMARRLAAPPKPSLPIPGSVDCVYLRCVGELDQEELRRSLTEVLLGRAETPSSPRKSHKGPLRVHHVKGYFRQEPGAPLMRVAAVRGRALSFAPTESLVVLPVVSDSRNNDALFGRLDIAIHTHLDKDVAGGEFLFVGTSPLSRSILERALEDSQPVIAPLRVEKCPETLTPHDIASIEREHRDEPLPSGWFYDGARYVDHEGSAQQRHPNFDLWAAQSVASQNVKIRAENEYIRKKRAMLTPLKFL